MGVLLSIFNGLNLLFTVVIPDIQTAMKIKAIFELKSTDITVNVTDLAGQAVTADDDTIAAIAAWRAKNGLPPATPPAATS